MDCCETRIIESHFDRTYVEYEVENYNENGPDEETTLMADALLSEGVDGCTLLDVGGGVGAIEFELLEAGLRKATNVEASSAYLEAAKEEAARQGFIEQVKFVYGNFVELAPDIPAADIVTLDKVICCYDDMEALVSSSVEKAGKLYALVYPRDTWYIKLGIKFMNLIHKLKGDEFSLYVHPNEEVDRRITENGMKLRLHKTNFVWNIMVFAR